MKFSPLGIGSASREGTMWGWLRRLLRPAPLSQEPEPFQAVADRRVSHLRSDGVLIIDRLDYFPHGPLARVASVRGAEIIGVRRRKSDGFTCLAVRMPGSSRAYNVELAAIVAIVIGNREFRPKFHDMRWEQAAAQLREFIDEAS